MFFRRANRDQSKKPDETATPLAPEGRDEAGEAAAADPSAASAAVSESERETRVPTEKPRPRVDPSRLPFKTTADLQPASGLIGQDRALKAIAFGAGVKARDFNIFVLGPPASGKSTAVRAYLEG